jgi:hypothetical protein
MYPEEKKECRPNIKETTENTDKKAKDINLILRFLFNLGEYIQALDNLPYFLTDNVLTKILM